MSITALGTGSGLDLESLVVDLVNAEIAPQSAALDSRQISLQTELSAVGSLKSVVDGLVNALSDFADVETFLKRSASSGNGEVYSVKADSTAQVASYNIEVTQLARQQRLRSAAYADSETAVGTGTLTIQVGPTPTEEGESAVTFDIVLEEGSNSLAQLRDAINNAEDNPGVTASIIEGDEGAFLALSSDDPGKANELTITASGDSVGLEGLTFDPAAPAPDGLQQTQEALDSIIVVDGVTVSSSSNTVTSAIAGVTITLLEEDPGNTSTLAVTLDEAAINSRIDRLISAYNSVADLIVSLTSYDPDTQTGGPLLGDATTRTLESQLRAVAGGVVEGIEGSFNSLSAIGISFDGAGRRLVKDNSLEGFDGIDSVSEAIEADAEGVAQLLASENGIAAQLLAVAQSYVDGDEDGGTGVLDERISGLEASLEEIDEERQELNDRAIALEEQFRAEFLALDLLLAELNSTSAFLSEQLASLPTLAELSI